MHILSINAELKFIEFILNNLDNADDSKTVGEIRREFLNKFETNLPHMLNQHFGIIRLIPILLMREELKNKGKKYDKKISIMRHALAHNNFTITKTGYEFNSDIGDCQMDFSEFVDFLYVIENEFYKQE